MNPHWLDDLDRQATRLPFGEMEVHVLRHRSTTSRVTYFKKHSMAPKSAEEALLDIKTLLLGLVDAKMTGKLQFDVDLEKGTIKLITIKNKEVKNYG